jgi:hypothetical protein
LQQCIERQLETTENIEEHSEHYIETIETATEHREHQNGQPRSDLLQDVVGAVTQSGGEGLQ